MTDFEELVASLAKHQVAFIVVGGAAAIAHGSARLTQDVEIVYDRSPTNLDRLVATLAEHKPYLRGAPPGLRFPWDRVTLARGLNFTLTTSIGDIDLLGEIPWGGDYPQLMPDAIGLQVFQTRCLCLAWLEDYAAAQLEGTDAAVPEQLERGIRFEHVSFAYPGIGRLVLEEVDLELKPGPVVAIVGENGAGKTTLVKLLCGLCRPSKGRILADGEDLARMPRAAWRTRLDDRPAVDGLAAGLDTQLGPTWPGGVEISFGQWQKLALARGFLRETPLLLVLDEPTAALDAETEHALFERCAAAARGGGRITILVSHRFSTVRMADSIVVLDGARVLESGSHEELVTKDRQYAELYQIQAAAYR